MSLVHSYNNFRGTIVERTTKPGIFEVEGVVQRAGAKNQNGRVYPKEVLEREVQKYIDTEIREGRAYGELDHPESEIVEFKNASHIVKELWWDGDDLMARIEILDTPAGNIAKAILKAGHTLGISSRGTGSVKNNMKENFLEVQNDFHIICWDFVTNPSTHQPFVPPQ